MKRRAIIIGAGPAGLTAAYELLKRTGITPVVLEKSDIIGGISRTTNYKGNRMDMGPHRFFSKSDRVMDWWLNIMPLNEDSSQSTKISYQNKTRNISPEAKASVGTDKVMLVIQRLTRIYFLRQFFAYPIQLTLDTLKTLGFIRTIKIMFSFLWIRLFPRIPEKSLEDFIVNKFGVQLYLLFFKSYTEKVWGIPPSQISAEWGAQRIKGVSLSKAIAGAVKSLKKKQSSDISQKETETSLIEQFLYPKYGPGSLWEEVARQVQDMGGQIYLNQDVNQISVAENQVISLTTTNSQTGETFTWEGDYFFSSMPVQELIADLTPQPPAEVREVAEGLLYRDFINVGVLLKQLSNKQGKKLELKDNWIYIQEKDVKVGRLMIYNNWGNGMIKDPNTTWIGMEYFCNKTDDLWAMDDKAIQALAIRELEQMDLARTEDILDSTVRRMEKTYPAYFGTYDRFDTIKDYISKFQNLFLVGRNGMHKYNNADHSMLCAMVAVDNIVAGINTKENLWSINTEQEYHEEKVGETETSIQPQRKTDPQLKSRAPKAPSPASFKTYVLTSRNNQILLWVASIAIILQFLAFKLIYPYAGFISGDSYVYLQSAYMNYDINTYPIGYSKFLRLFSVFTNSDTALVAFQYLIIQCSALYLYFTLLYLYQPSRTIKLILFTFILFNPVFLYISNYVSSDSLFLALSVFWFTLLIWIVRRPTFQLLAIHTVILFLAFTVRYNALYYPIISALAFLLTKQPLWKKCTSIAVSILVIAVFMSSTSKHYQELTGIRQFTPFSGWQMANNAMYAYRYVSTHDYKDPPSKLKVLDNMVRHYFDTTRNADKHPEEMLVASTIYMWDPRSPLQKFMALTFQKDSLSGPLKRWASMAPLYQTYGSYLIRQYPLEFAKYYLWPNTLKFYTPPEEFLDTYNMGRDSVDPIAQSWFRYRTNKVKSIFKDYNVSILSFLPILSGIMNAIFLIALVFVWLLKGKESHSLLSKVLLLAACLWFLNFSFSVFASPITLRYQLFSILIFSSFAFLLIDQVYKSAFSKAVTPFANNKLI